MKRIYLAVGHGVQANGVFDPGAVRAGVYTEQTAGDIVVETAAEILRRNGFTVKDEARQDDPNWVGTAKLANAFNADLTVAVHHEWTGGVDGAFGFFHGPGAGRDAGSAILKQVEAAGFKTVWSWFRAKPDLGLLRTTDHPAFLFEAGRIGDKTLDTPGELERMGAALAHGIMKYYGVTPQTGGDNMAVSDWARSAWDWAKSKGLVNSDSDPQATVTKQELMVFLKRAADNKVFAVTHNHPLPEHKHTLPDHDHELPEHDHAGLGMVPAHTHKANVELT